MGACCVISINNNISTKEVESETHIDVNDLEAKIKQLTSMGYDRAKVENYLEVAEYNILVAMKWLTQASTPSFDAGRVECDIADMHETEKIEGEGYEDDVKQMEHIRDRKHSIIIAWITSEESLFVVTAGGYVIARLMGNYLLFYDGSKNKKKFKQTVSLFANLRSMIDLSEIVKYSMKKDFKNDYACKLFDVHGNSKDIYFKENDSEFVSQVIECLNENNAKLETERKSVCFKNEVDFKQNETDIILALTADETDTKEEENTPQILYSSHLFFLQGFEQEFFYCRLENKRILLYDDYAKSIIPDNVNVDNTPIKIIDILNDFQDVQPFMFKANSYGFKLVLKTNTNPGSSRSLLTIISKCEHNHELVEMIMDADDVLVKCNECLSPIIIQSKIYVCQECKYYVCTNCVITSLVPAGSVSFSFFDSTSNTDLYFLSLSRNERDEWLLHLQFLLSYKIMPYDVVNKGKNDMEILDDYTSSSKENSSTDAFALLKKARKQKNTIYSVLAVTDDEVKNALINGSSNTEKLYFVDKLYVRWRKAKESNEFDDFPSIPLCLDALSIPCTSIIRWYSGAIRERNIDKQQYIRRRCSSALSCTSHMHYMRDRSQGNEDISDNNDTISVFKNAQDSQFIDIIDKVHSFLYEHTLKDEEISNEETKEDGPMITVDENTSVIWKKKITAQCMPSINILKFVFEANEKQIKSKFGFGVNCAYSYFFKTSDNFVIPYHLSLFTEICCNLFIENTVKPMVFWSLYLQSITYKNAFMGYFTARDLGLGNYKYNEEAGCLMSINHYLSLILYSICEQFQNEFKKYTIRMNDESDDEFYVRNSYVAHWQRYLYESVYFFGSKFPSNSSVVYCGINIPLLFDSYEQMISAPLSTTTNERIALKFTEDEGIILELQRKDEQSSRYFPLEYISPYAEECEWFVCGTPLKIKTIGYHSSNSKLNIVYSCEKYIEAILLLEKILRGQLFVDMHLQGLAKQENIQLLMEFMTAHMNSTIIDEHNKNENIASDFLQYCQRLFNSRVIQFTSEDFDDYENDIWLNNIELERIKCLPLKESVINFLSATTAKKINFATKPISFIVDGGILDKFKMLEEGQFLEIGDIFEEGEFAFEMKLLKSHSMDPNKCFLFLFLRRMPEWCKSLTVYFDILCLEMKYECVDIWDTFNNVHDYIGRPIFSNDQLANTDSFSVCLCLRI